MLVLVGFNLPKRLWCRRGFEVVIVLWVFAFSCGVGTICDSRVGNLRGVHNFGGGIAFEGWSTQYPWGLHQLVPSHGVLVELLEFELLVHMFGSIHQR